MAAISSSNFDIYAGSEIGYFKGVDVKRNTFSNLTEVSSTDKTDEITALCWEDSSQKKILYGQKNQVVNIFDCEQRCITKSHNFEIGKGAIRGLSHINGRIATAVESGIVKVWNEEKEEVKISAGENLCRMRQNLIEEPFHIATGGEENELKLWDVNRSEKPIFQAKNVRNDFLDLRVPVWITDLQFHAKGTILTCTRHHHVRLYDPRAQRRPVINMEFEKNPLMSLSVAHNEFHVMVGSSKGRLALIDLRKKLLVHVFKGFAGSIRCVQCHPTFPLVASCGLDRFLRIHQLNTRQLLKKIYLKARLNCLLMKTSIENVSATTMVKTTKISSTEVADKAEEQKIWDAMPVVGGKTKRIRLDSASTNSTCQTRPGS